MDKEAIYKTKKIKISGFTENGRNKNLLKQKELLEKKGWEFVSFEEPVFGGATATFRKEIVIKKKSKHLTSLISLLQLGGIISLVIFIATCVSWLNTPTPKKIENLTKFEKIHGKAPTLTLSGKYLAVEWYLEDRAKDPDSLKISNCTEVYKEKSQKGWLVGCTYRAKNSFGGYVVNSNWFIISNDKVTQMLDFSAYKQQ